MTMSTILCLVFSVLIANLPSCISAVSTLEEERLLDYLHRKGSHPLARPVKNVKDAVILDFGISVKHLELDEKAETLYGNHWFSYSWNSPFLTWDPANFSDIKSVRVPLQYMWQPDISAYNSKEDFQVKERLAVVYSDGSINYVPKVHTATICDLDLTYFPYDVQLCTLIIGSWTYHGDFLNITLRNNDVDVTDYTPNKAWRLVKSEAKRIVKKYSCCPERYITLKFYFTLARESSYFVYVYVGPVAILSLLGAAIFVLPPESSQKMTLGGALLICYGLFFLDASYVMPPIHASTPTIDKYYMAMYIMLAISVFLSAIITNLAQRSWTRSHPPEIVKKVILGGLARVLFVSTSSYDNFGSGTEDLSEVKSERGTGSGGHGAQLNQIKDWYLMATVFDRLFLLVYIVLTILLALSILLNYPKQ